MALFRCMLFWVAPLFFVFVAPLFLQIHGGEGSLPSLLHPLLGLVSLSFASLLADRRWKCGAVFPLVVCVGQLVSLVVLVSFPWKRPGPSISEERRLAPLAAGFLAGPGAVGRASGKGKISIVLPCATEGEYAKKTVMSFCDRTASEALQEIIVVDDGSSPPLTGILQNIDARCKLRILRHAETMGLMIAKQTGGDAADGEFIGFFDCHVAPNKDWHVEIMRLLHDHPRRLVVPTITDLDLDSWDERRQSAVNSKCYIDWNADFMWFEDNSDFIPVISGGLVATTKSWWNTSGGFDEEMRGWGGENIDQSLRAWLCGGDIIRAKSSRIAHMWRVDSDGRTRAHYRRVTGTDNTARVAASWFGDFLMKFQQGRLVNYPPDVSNVKRTAEALHCKPFAYFLHRFRRVYKNGGMLPKQVFHLKSEATGLCVDRQGASFVLTPCDGNSQIFHFANQDPAKNGKCCSGIRMWNSLECFDRFDDHGPLPYYCDVVGNNQNQQWRIDEEGHLRHGSGDCLSTSGEGQLANLVRASCKTSTRWTQADVFLPPETKLYEEAVKKYGYSEDMPDN